MEYIKVIVAYIGAFALGGVIALWLTGELYQYGMPIC